ncbi:helix-turn-helix domain-containing protein [Paraburkholderia diazotrophica]|uniref:Helix-turn-helix domain-containing protein n=1 Tax=Paraburkholderia diazotrophica TaxID=667676 RepID=A0A1H7CC81_9BURK|nr:hypothetical protein [Paraburkholderia diazotrophica]SEJ87301.1 hypothetical protein SAMN05192539_102172 [Paraburkholderia diazotrophica]
MNDDRVPNYATLRLHHLAHRRLRQYPFEDHRRGVIYGVLIDHMDIERTCWPGAELLGREAYCSKPTVLKILREFERDGLVFFIDPVVRGGRKGRRIRVNFECLAQRVAVKHDLTAGKTLAVKPVLTANGNLAVKKAAFRGRVAVKP